MQSFKTYLGERSLTPGEEKKKEEIKKALLADPEFKKKHGDEAESRAFAIATSKAKEMKEETEQLDEALIPAEDIVKNYKPFGVGDVLKVDEKSQVKITNVKFVNSRRGIETRVDFEWKFGIRKGTRTDVSMSTFLDSWLKP